MLPMEKLHIKKEEELQTVATRVLELLIKQKDINGISVLALSGDLGAGKTSFMKVLAHAIGVVEEVTSPTFVVMNHYEIESDTGAQKTEFFAHLYHLDAYRIEEQDEMRVIHFDEILKTEHALVCIEWAERIKELLPAHTMFMDIALDGQSETERTITLSYGS